MSIMNKATELVREIYDRNVNYYTGWLSSQRYSPKMFPINTKIPYSIEFKAKKNYLLKCLQFPKTDIRWRDRGINIRKKMNSKQQTWKWQTSLSIVWLLVTSSHCHTCR